MHRRPASKNMTSASKVYKAGCLSPGLRCLFFVIAKHFHLFFIYDREHHSPASRCEVKQSQVNCFCGYEVIDRLFDEPQTYPMRTNLLPSLEPFPEEPTHSGSQVIHFIPKELELNTTERLSRKYTCKAYLTREPSTSTDIIYIFLALVQSPDSQTRRKILLHFTTQHV